MLPIRACLFLATPALVWILFSFLFILPAQQSLVFTRFLIILAITLPAFLLVGLLASRASRQARSVGIWTGVGGLFSTIVLYLESSRESQQSLQEYHWTNAPLTGPALFIATYLAAFLGAMVGRGIGRAFSNRDIEAIQAPTASFGRLTAAALLILGVFLVVFSCSIVALYVDALPTRPQMEFRMRKLSEHNEYGIACCGLAVLLAGTFLLFFGRSNGLLLKATPIANRVCAFLPAAKLICVAFLFCLPWVDIRCQCKMRDGSKTDEIIIRQSGFQLATGRYEDRSPKNPFDISNPNQKALAKEPGPALLMALYGIVITLGAIASLTVRRPSVRLGALLVSSVTAVCLITAQGEIGFPIEAALVDENSRFAADPQFAKPESLVQGPPTLVLQKTWWYYTAFLLTAAAAFASVLDWSVNRRTSIVQLTEIIPEIGLH